MITISTVLITGASGQLGRALHRLLSARGVATIAVNHADAPIDSASIVERIVGSGADLVVNAAAFTQVDRAELEPAQAYAVNAHGAHNVASACRLAGVPLIHVSTNCIFDGDRDDPYREDDAARPISVYGASKYAGEALVAAAHDQHYIVRTSWLYGPGGANFVTKVLGLARTNPDLSMVADEIASPTAVDDLAVGLMQLATTGCFGVHHLTNEGVASRLEFAQAVLDHANLRHVTLRPVMLDSFARPSRPPRYSALANERAAAVGVRLPSWRVALQRYMATLQESEAACPT